MQLSSPEFENNQAIPVKYTCDGENVNPPLTVTDVPVDAQSLVLIVEDPDAPHPNYTHWILFNISPGIDRILTNVIPTGSSTGRNDAGLIDYTGPCPSSGVHRYFFTLYALDTILETSDSPSKDELKNKMKDHIIDSAQLTGTYAKNLII